MRWETSLRGIGSLSAREQEEIRVCSEKGRVTTFVQHSPHNLTFPDT